MGSSSTLSECALRRALLRLEGAGLTDPPSSHDEYMYIGEGYMLGRAG